MKLVNYGFAIKYRPDYIESYLNGMREYEALKIVCKQNEIDRKYARRWAWEYLQVKNPGLCLVRVKISEA